MFHVRVDATAINQPNHLETDKNNYTWSYATPIPHVHYRLCTLHQSMQCLGQWCWCAIIHIILCLIIPRWFVYVNLHCILTAATCTHSKVDVQTSVVSPNHSSRGVVESHKPSSLTVPHS